MEIQNPAGRSSVYTAFTEPSVAGGENPATTVGDGLRSVGGTTKIIDVMTGEATPGAFGIYQSTGAWEINAEGLPERQQADLEALLSIFGIDMDNAKAATIQTVLQAILANIKEQSCMLSGSLALSKADTATLQAMKASLEMKGDGLSLNEKNILGNVNRMLELKNQIEAKVAQGYVYDRNFDEHSTNFTLNTDVREMGDRIGDIRLFMRQNGGMDSLNGLFDGVLPAMKEQFKGFLTRCNDTVGWGISVTMTYSGNTTSTLQTFSNVLQDPTMRLPPQIDREKLVAVLEEIIKQAKNPEHASAEELLQAKLAEIVAQLQDIQLQMPVTA